MKRYGLFSALVLAASLLVFNTSCEIGLGASVDIAAPTVSVTYPEQSSVIRDTFVLAGECDDDKSVSKVNITILRTDTGKSQTVKQIEAPADNATGKWSAKINEYLGEGKGYNGWELCDGKYVANVVSIDNTGRSSGVASISFDIDNTAPIFILKNPTSENTSTPTSYGTTFKVAGTMSDDHTVSTMTIKIYDKDADFSDPENPPVPLETVIENNIDTTAEVLIANYSRAGELKDRYDKMYADTPEGEDKTLVCTIEVQDNAKVYKDPSETENNSTGNTTSNFYITDKVSNIWTSGDMDPGRVKKVVNGTATNVSESLAESVLKLYNESASTTAAFSINSDSNPSYEISSSGYAKDKPITKLATTSATLTFNLTYGRNQENILPETVKVFLWGPFNENEVTEEMRNKMYSTDWETLYAYYNTLKDVAGIKKARVIAYNGEGEWEGKKYLKDGVPYTAGYDEGSKDSLTQTIELTDSIVPNKYYYISAYAEDLMGAAAKPKTYVYGFKGQSNGGAPEIKWEDTSYGANAAENQDVVGAGALNFYGYVKYPDGTETKSAMTYKAERTDVSGVPIISGDLTELGRDENEGYVYWTMSIPGVAEDTESVESWKITVNATSTNGSGVTAEDKRSFIIDTQKPVISLTSLTPSIPSGADKYINGTIKIEGSLTEKNPSKLWFDIYSNDSKVYSTESSPYGESTRSINEVINTTDAKYNLTDDSSFKVVFWAEDKAGNKASKETSTYILKQSTDKPSITVEAGKYDASGKTKANLKSTAWFNSTDKLEFSIADDDEIAEVTVKVNNGAAVAQAIPSKQSSFGYNYYLTNLADGTVADGIYTLTVTATDSTYGESGLSSTYKDLRKVSWGPYTIGVDTSNPEVTDDNAKGTNYYKKGTKATFSGTAKDKNGIKEIEVAVIPDEKDVAVKTYKLSSSEVTYSTSTNIWSVAIADGVIPDGTYTVTTTVTDYAGKTATKNSVWIFDTKNPKINEAKVSTTGKTVATETWYNTTTLDLSVTVTDDFDGVTGSGVDSVSASLNGTDWTIALRTAGSNTWTGKVNCVQGTNKIYIKAKDKVGFEQNLDGNFITVKVDTEAPSTFDFVTLDGQTDTSKLINGTAGIPLVVKAADTLTGISSVRIIQIGNTKYLKYGETDAAKTSLISSSSAGENYTINIPKANLEIGDVYVEVADGVGNKTSKKVATINIDKVAPKITINAPSPIVEGSSAKYLNGTIKITGKIEETNLDKVWYKVYSNGSEVTYAADQSLEAASDISFEIDTTNAAITDKKSFDVVIYASDKAKNQATPVYLKSKNGGTTFTVDQSTDNPVIKPNNFTYLDAKTNTKESLTSWFNGTPIIGTVTDDDNISSVSIETKNEAGSSVVTAAATQNIPTFTYYLPTDAAGKPKDGVYQVTVTATDDTYSAASTNFKKYRQTVYGPFLVGVDSASPTVSEDHSTGTNYVDGVISLSGSADDANGIKDIKVEVFLGSATTATKTYLKSESKVTYNTSTKKWSCSIADADLADGEYRIKTTAYDYANKESSIYSTFVKDKVAPTVTPSFVTAVTKTVGTTKWFKATSIDIKAVVTDSTSGVATVQYSLDGTEWFSLKQGSTEATKTQWTATAKCAQGANTIYFKATDKAGKVNDTQTLTCSADTAAPETLTLFSVDGTEGFSGTKMIKGTSALTFVVSAADSGIGLATVANGGVKITKIAGTTLGTPIKASSVTNGKYTIEIPVASLKSGAVTVTATDLLGNTTSEDLFTLSVDGTAPDVSISSVTPVISKDSHKYVNGKIKISGKANDLNLERVWYQVVVGGTAGSEIDLENGVEIELDTTKYTNGKSLDVIVYAIDKAGNQSSAKASSVNGTTELLFTIDQATDTPEITASNITYLAAPASGAATAASIVESAWFTGTASNNVIGNVSDDDVLSSVKIVTKNAAGTSTIGSETELIASGSTASTINYSYPLPAADGVYQVTISVKDSTYNDGGVTANRSATYGPFVVGVDKTAPVITETHSSTTNFITGDISLSGTATDTNGIRDVEVKVVNSKTKAVVGTYNVDNGVTLSDSSWSCTVSKLADGTTALPDGKYTVTATAKDYAGKTASVDSKFVKDNKAPSVSASVSNPAGTTIDSKVWYGTNTITVTATATDDVCDVTEVMYSFDNSDWSPFKQTESTKWTANVNCPAQGENKIYIKATDEAGKTGKIQNDCITVYVDSKEPEFCMLYSIDGSIEFTNKKLVNGQSAVKFCVTVKDSATETCSGIKSVTLKSVGTKTIGAAATNTTSNEYECTISTSNLVSGAVVVTVTDNLNKSKDFTLFTIEKDVTAPESTITTLKDADTETDVIDINGTDVTFTGSASDEIELSAVNLYYYVGTSKPSVPTTVLGNTGSWTGKGWKTLAYTGSKYAWTAVFDTTTASYDKKNLYFYAVATDAAGNSTATEYPNTLYINQDSDRPKISLTNLALTEESSSSYVSTIDNGNFWHTSSYIQGTVIDDDGAVKAVYWSKDGTSWSSNIYAKGSWKITDLDEGTVTIYFKVVDAKDKEFVSAATGMTGPKIYDSNDQACLGFSGTGKLVSEVLPLKVDTKNPTITTLYGYASDSATYSPTATTKKLSEMTTLGGTNKYLYVVIDASDDNGIKTVVAKLDGTTATTTNNDAMIVSQNTGKTKTVVRFDLSKLTLDADKKTETKKVEVSVTDNADKPRSTEETITIDNKAPVISFTNKAGSTVYGSITNVLYGKTTDGSEIDSLWYKVTTTNTAPTSGWSEVAYSTAAENQIAKDNWSITFDGNSPTVSEYHTSFLNDIYQTLSGLTDAQMEALDTNVDMYVWVYAKDTIGNESTPVSLLLKVVPNADKPTVEISYPKADSSVGGTIRVTGNASIVKDSVSKVYVQIDPSYSATDGFASDWATELAGLKDANYTIVDTGLASPYNKGILASGTTGWSTTINSGKDLDTKVAGSDRKIAIRAFAVSKTKQRISDPSVITTTIDSNSPLFGDLYNDGYRGMRLVQYASGTSGTKTANQAYTDGMAIKGQWYLVGSISDPSGIVKATVKFPGQSNATVIVDAGAITSEGSGLVTELSESNSTSCKNYLLNIPVGVTTADEFGDLTYEVTIWDGSDSQSIAEYAYVLSYDNKAPDFAVTTENKGTIVQSDGTYSIAGTANEDSDPVSGASQSGLERIVMYVTKTLSGTTYVVDPMISNGTTGTANREAVSTLTKADSDGLYWRTATVSAINNGAITVTKLGGTAVTEVEPKVRAGGLCKVDGIIYRIKAIDGATVQLNDTTVINSSLKTVYFAAGALVVDNSTPEGGNNTAVYDPAKSDSLGSDSVQTTAGDGDQMMESARLTGTQTDWSLAIDSTQILDGDVTVHFVAYDKAGNKNDSVSYAATVKNNAPRLAGVIYGSDLNNNGVIEGNEWYREDADQYVQRTLNSSSTNEKVNGMLSDGTPVVELTGTKRQTIKSDITVIPQVVGGNLGLDWTMTYRDNNGATKTTTSKTLSDAHSQRVIRTYGTDSSAADYKTANENSYKMSVSTLEFLQLNSNVGIDRRTGKEEQNLVFTITDKNEDAANKASVKVNIPVKILFADGVAPTGKLKPFHWNSSSDNSLYNNSKAYGHIELPSDWKNGTTGYTDSIPKVSGIVTFEGEARDNVLVNQIAMKFGTGTQFTIAQRDGTTWTSDHLLTLSEDDPDTADVDETKTYEDYFTASTDSWYFELVDDYTDEQNYNVVKFKFHWNSRTNLPGNVVALTNVPAQLVVTDKGSVGLDTAKTGLAYTNTKGNTVGTTQTTDASNTAYYKMDVVPYVAQVYTELAALKKNNDSEWSIASRTALGRYPVRVTTYDQSRSTVTNGGETISFYGFNLAGATYTDNRTSGAATTTTGTGTKLSTVEGFYDVRTLRADLLRGDASNYSGPVVLKVNSINTINNANNNNAKGSYTGTLNNDTYAEAAYNRIPNDANNAALTDDLYFDVWQVNEGAARSSGRIEQPNMKVDPLTKKLGFAFIDSTFHFAMAGTTTKNNAPATNTANNNSYTQWIRSVDFCTSAAFTYDSKGRTWGVTAGNESNTDKDDMLALVSSSWGANKDNYTYNSNINVRIGRTSQDSWTNNDKQRYKNPSMVSAVHSNRTSLYLAYYDNLNDEIRIQYGRMTDSTTVSGNRDMSDIGNYNTAANETYDYLRSKVSVVAGDAKTTDDYKPATDKKAGEYLSIAVITSEGTNLDDKLIIVWYDGSTLWYSINTDPDADYSDTTKGYRGSWSTPVRVFDEDGTMAKAGEYCRVAVDKNGGVHIAGYDQSNKDLCYAYLPANKNAAPTQQSDFVTRVVDSNGVTGSNISIDVGVDGSGNIVPHISYYSESLLRAKEAYYVGGFANNATTAILAGVDDYDNYTGAWEVSPVPTRRTLEMQSNQYNAICLGLWKTSGVIGNSTTGTDSDAIIWGNGTANPAVGYVTQVSSVKSCIEVAQKR